MPKPFKPGTPHTGFKGIFEEAKHKRDSKGQFAHTAGVGATKPAWLHAIKGKSPPASFKFYKPGYKPKPMGGHTSSFLGQKLWQHKQAGHFDNDYEFWLAAQKLASQHNKQHPTHTVKPHAVVNAAFNHEINATGGLNIGGVKPANVPDAPKKHIHDKTNGGINLTSKHAPPGTLTKFVKTMPGASGAQLWVDDKGQEWLVKGNKPGSNAYGVKFAVALEEALAKIQNKAGLRSATSHKTVLDMQNGTKKEVLAQKMFGDVEQAIKGDPKVTDMTDADLLDMQKQQIFDWVISNWDTHTGNFLKDNEGIIGIDKGQAFKFFGKDKLDWNYVPVTPLGADKLTYSTMWKQYVNNDAPFMFSFDNSPELHTFAERLKNIPDDEYKKLLRPYAEEAHDKGILGSGSMSINHFLTKAVARKNNVVKDFEAFYAKAKVEHDKNSSKDDWEQDLLPPPPDESSNVNVTSDGFLTGPLKIGQKVKVKGVGTGWEYGKVVDVEGNSTYVTYSDDPGVIADWVEYVQYGDIWTSDPTDPSDDMLMPADDDGNVTKSAVEKPFPDVAGKLAVGYAIVKHPEAEGKFAIQKPTGDFSKNPAGEIKSWATAEDALNSSTMLKYKNLGEAQLKASLSGAQSEAANAPDFAHVFPNSTKSGIAQAASDVALSADELIKYQEIKGKIAAAQHTPQEYVEFKTLKGKILGAKKAAGAAQIEDDFDGPSFVAPVVDSPKKKTGFKEQPKFKLKGGAPPSLDKAKGPNALELGKQLWEMKKAGKITSDYEMWNTANKLANADKKKAGPGAVVGEHYSSKNSIRNVAMRLEFDETGDVVWETTEEKTSQEVGQTLNQIKATNALHDHVPTYNSPTHHPSIHADPSHKPGTYQNPHSFKHGDTKAIRDYGYKYTSHSNWDQSQKSAWYSFSGSGYQTMNTYFRTGDVGAFGNPEHTKKQAQNLVKAFQSENVKPLDDWTIVTRGTNGGWEFGIGSDTVSFEDIKSKEGKVIRNKCPVSSSLRTNSAFGGGVRITYKLPPGFRGLSILGHSAHAGEDEMILPPGMAYRVLKVDNNGGHIDALVEVVDVKLPEIA